MSEAQEREKAIKECLKRHVGDVGVKKADPIDKVAYAQGEREMTYRVGVVRGRGDGSTDDGVVLMDVYKSSGEWRADYIRHDFY